MAMPYTPSERSQQAIIEFLKQCVNMPFDQWNLRSRLEEMDRQYMREVDWTEEQYKARMSNRLGNPTKFQNVTIPVVMPQVEAAVTYQQSVFLTGYPIFGVVSGAGLEDAAQQMDTIIGEQQIKGNWVPEYLKAIRNGFKYNLGPCEVDWDREVTYALETDVRFNGGKEGRPVEILWQGNKVKSWDPYNTFWDTRCMLSEVPRWGEFAGELMLMSRIRLKKYMETLPTRINVTKAFESGWVDPGGWGSSELGSYYIPTLNPDALLNLNLMASTNWDAWAGISGARGSSKIDYKNMYQVTKLYGRIMPSDFDFKGIPGPNQPQVWKFIIVNNQVVIYAERMTNAHDMIPVSFAQPLDDGLSYQTKSFAENIIPFQQICTALANSSIAARRRAVSDRMLYDSSRVSPAAINNESPTAKIPVRPSAMGTKLSDAVFPIPFNDNQFQFNQAEMQMYLGMTNVTSGLNPARQGQFVKGNKTRSEFDTIMGNANGRDQTVALTMEGNFFMPQKEIIKANILQYQGGVGLYNREAQKPVQIDPVVLRKAQLMFNVSDGLMPSDKLIDGDVLQVVLQTVAQSPQLAAAYNVGPMFSYLMKSRGAKLSPFEKSQEQLAYEQAMQQWQQAVAMVATEVAKREPQPSPEDIQRMLPPQPKPADFGYVPGKIAEPLGSEPSILSSVAKAMAPPQQTPTAPQGPQQP